MGTSNKQNGSKLGSAACWDFHMSQGEEALCPSDHTNLTKLPKLVVLILTGDCFNPNWKLF